jgi:hypothetical protein
MSKKVVFNLEVDSNLNEVDKSIQDIVSSGEDLKKQFSQLQKAAQNATNPDDFRRYAEAAGQVRDRIQDTNKVINQFASDTQKLDVAIGTVQGLAGAFAVVKGTSALFGEENEKLNETLLKVQGSIAVLNGLQQVANTLNKDSVVGTKLYAAANGILNSSFLNVNKGLKAFRLALIGTGIGAIVVALGLLIANFDKVRDAVFKLIPGLEKLTKFFGQLIQRFTDYIGVTSAANRELEKFIQTQDRKIANTQREIRDLEQLGATQREIYEAKNRLIDEEIAKLEAALITKGKLTEEENDQLTKLLEQRRTLTNNFFIQEQEAAKRNEENRIKLIRDEGKRRLEEIRLNYRRELEEARRLGLDTLLIEKRFKRELSDFQKLESDRVLQREFSANLKFIELTQGTTKRLIVELEERLKAIDLTNKERENLQIELNNAEEALLKETLINEKRTFDEKRLILVDYYTKRILELQEQGKVEEELALRNEANLKIALLQGEDSYLKELRERRLREADEINQIENDKLLSVEERFNKRKEIDDKFFEEFLQNEIQYLKDVNRFLSEFSEENLDSIIVNNKEILKLETELQTRLTKIVEEENIKRRNIFEATNRLVVEGTLDTLDGLLGINQAFANKSDANAKRAFENSKRLQIAQALISTYGGAVQAYQSQIIPLDPTSPIRGAIAAAAVVASGLGRVAAIRSTQFNSTSSPQSSTSVAAPSVANPFIGNQQNPIVPEVMMGKRGDEDGRVYVLESDIRNTGRRVDVIEGRALGRF